MCFEVKAPPGLEPDTQLWGGGTLIFDQFAKLRFHQRKGLAWDGRPTEDRPAAPIGLPGRARYPRSAAIDWDSPTVSRLVNVSTSLHVTDTDATESW